MRDEENKIQDSDWLIFIIKKSLNSIFDQSESRIEFLFLNLDSDWSVFP